MSTDTTSDRCGRTGVVVPRDLPAAQIVPFARRAETLGFDEAWIVEDCFFRGGIAQAAVVLASTTHIGVGIGILPAPARNAAFTALEANTLAEIYPGRIQLGIGHGMPDWMRQAGARVASPLSLLDEQLTAVRGLLAGDRVSLDGRYVRLDAVALESPASTAPPVLAGVRGPRSLALSGRRADGTILAEPVTPEYLAVALGHIDASGEHRVVAYNLAAVDDDSAAARERVRPALERIGEPDWAPHIRPLPFAAEFTTLRERSETRQEFVEALPDEWIDALTLAGTPARVRGRMQELHAAGATSVVFIPVSEDPLAELDSLARALLGGVGHDKSVTKEERGR